VNPSSFNSFQIHITYFVAWQVDSAIVGCHLLFQLIVVALGRKTYLVVDFSVFKSTPQSKSLQDRKSLHYFLLFL